MKSRQSGFTLVEVAIVLVIVGLLLGGILKGQEMINSARIKNLGQDFRVLPGYVYAYQDKYRALPGDDNDPVAHLGAAGTRSTTGGTPGNSVIEGNPLSTVATEEAFLFWQHVRLANLAPGQTDITAPDFLPKNSVGGRVGLAGLVNGIGGNAVIDKPTLMTGTYQVCSEGIVGKFAKQLDSQVDDGNTAMGSMRASLLSAPDTAIATTAVDDRLLYTVCMTF